MDNLEDETSGLFLYSGKCIIGKVGDKTELKDSNETLLFVGDLVTIKSKYSSPEISVVADNKYQTFSNGTVAVRDSGHFIMGIKGVSPQEWAHHAEEDAEWVVIKIKDYSLLVVGEQWKNLHRVDVFQGVLLPEEQPHA